MTENGSDSSLTLALSTKVEEEFVAPLTAVRGSLEILRDFPDLAEDDRRRFVDSALRACGLLEAGVEHLAATVYSAAQRATRPPADPDQSPASAAYAERVHFFEDTDTLELDFSHFEFSATDVVNEFYDVVDRLIAPTGRQWYCLVNFRDCRVFPEAWVAFAHRSKRFNVAHSLGTVRYAEGAETKDPEVRPSRQAALDEIAKLKSQPTTPM